MSCGHRADSDPVWRFENGVQPSAADLLGARRPIEGNDDLSRWVVDQGVVIECGAVRDPVRPPAGRRRDGRRHVLGGGAGAESPDGADRVSGACQPINEPVRDKPREHVWSSPALAVFRRRRS
jgi:hypothetical protein